MNRQRVFTRLAAAGIVAALPAILPAASMILNSSALAFAVAMNNGAALNMSATGVVGSLGIGTGSLSVTGGCTGNCQVTGVIDFSTTLNGSSGGYSVPTGDTISGTTIAHGTAYNPTAVSNAVSDYDSVSTTLATYSSLGTTLNLSTIGAGAVVNATSGYHAVINGVDTYFFTVTASTGQLAHGFTVNGGSNVNVVFNFAGSALNFTNTPVGLTGGMNGDQLIWNLTGTGVSLTSSGTAASNVVNGAFLLPNGNFSLSGITVDGLVFGGQSGHTSTISSTSVVDAPTPATPEPASLAMMFGGAALLAGVRLRRKR